MKNEAKLANGTACSVCGNPLSDPQAPNLCFVTLEEDDPLKLRESELEGTCVEICFIRTPLRVWALYTPRHSSAREAGCDLLFLCCREECCVKLAESIVRDATMFANLVRQ
jgi:hypothetical protein